MKFRLFLFFLISATLLSVLAWHLWMDNVSVTNKVSLNSDFKMLHLAIKHYYANFKTLPTSIDELCKKSTLKLINNVQKYRDPWGKKYFYKIISSYKCKVYSLGIDHKVGGKGFAKDFIYIINLKDKSF
ncbi:type II secretion system protein GspG [Candidatus Uabimicrobium sp. HlEnr_7]|uniref:type II secretion system protein GspG n=1 Tax=Candidatus Uabimicrobium helgolandensis TaxID=3095367 RepID=UPI003558E211